MPVYCLNVEFRTQDLEKEEENVATIEIPIEADNESAALAEFWKDPWKCLPKITWKKSGVSVEEIFEKDTNKVSLSEAVQWVQEYVRGVDDNVFGALIPSKKSSLYLKCVLEELRRLQEDVFL